MTRREQTFGRIDKKRLSRSKGCPARVDLCCSQCRNPEVATDALGRRRIQMLTDVVRGLSISAHARRAPTHMRCTVARTRMRMRCMARSYVQCPGSALSPEIRVLQSMGTLLSFGYEQAIALPRIETCTAYTARDLSKCERSLRTQQ